MANRSTYLELKRKPDEKLRLHNLKRSNLASPFSISDETPLKSVFIISFLFSVFYVALLLLSLFIKTPALIAYSLFILVPLAAILFPRQVICFLLLIYAISPIYLFSQNEGHPYSPYVLKLVFIELDLNGTMVLVIILSSISVIFTEKSMRGIRAFFFPFLPFIIISMLIWGLKAPTMQGIRNLSTFFSPIVFSAAVYVAIRSFNDIKHMRLSILVALPIAIFLSILTNILDLRQAFTTITSYSSIARFHGSSIAPHTAMACLPPISLLLGGSIIGKRYVWKYVLLLLAVIGLTVSRTAFGASLIMILATIFFVRRNKSTTIFVGFSIMIIAVGTFAPFFIERSLGMKRSIDKKFDEIIYTSGRLHLWKSYARLAAKKKWFGHGLGQDVLFHKKLTGTNVKVAHNEYLRLWFAVGIIGLSAYIYAMIKLLRNLLGRNINSFSREMQWSALMIFLGFALLAITDNPLSSIIFSVPTFAIIAMALRSLEMETSNGFKG